MQLLFEDDLVEQAVFLCASGRRRGAPRLQIARFQREREKIYALLDPDEKEIAFRRLHLAWFQEWGLAAALEQVVDLFPEVRERLNALGFRHARHKSEEGSELYVNPAGARHGVICLRADRFQNHHRLGPLLHHELMHLRDMVAPDFGYSPELPRAGSAGQRLLRERYRLFWDISIDGRLNQRGLATIAGEADRRAELARAFSFWPETQQAEVFNSLWSGCAPRHEALLALASDPRGLREADKPSPGASCPLCQFPTFEWADSAALEPETVRIIALEFPAWRLGAGLCRRCAEIYRAQNHGFDEHHGTIPFWSK